MTPTEQRPQECKHLGDWWSCERTKEIVNADDPFDMKQMLEQMSAEGWELVSTHQPNLAHLYLFFTRKKIKTYYE